jgi:hypothetical protein
MARLTFTPYFLLPGIRGYGIAIDLYAFMYVPRLLFVPRRSGYDNIKPASLQFFSQIADIDLCPPYGIRKEPSGQ